MRVRNPYNPQQVTEYRLTPDVVNAIAFCTKNPAPMLPHMDALKEYGQYWFITITPYGKDIEPGVPSAKNVMESFIELSRIIGKDCIGWRYDPIFLDGKINVEWHIAKFRKMAEKLSGCTETCVISFIDLYQKVRRNFPEVNEVDENLKIEIGKAFCGIAKEYGFTVKPCAEGNSLAEFGADCTGCSTQPVFEKAISKKLDVPKIQSSRPLCGCLLGNDIGSYDSCGHLCRYCYANTSIENVRKNMSMHDPESPFLIGHDMEGDIIHMADQKSWKQKQLSLF